MEDISIFFCVSCNGNKTCKQTYRTLIILHHILIHVCVQLLFRLISWRKKMHAQVMEVSIFMDGPQSENEVENGLLGPSYSVSPFYCICMSEKGCINLELICTLSIKDQYSSIRFDPFDFHHWGNCFICLT